MTLVLVLLVLAGAVVLLWITSIRRNRQLERLIARVEELEQGLSNGIMDEEAQQRVQEEESDSDPRSISSDALAGWTSHVGRILTGQSKPGSLAEQAVVAVHRRMNDPLRPSGLAKELAVSLRTLERVLDSTLECSPGDLILTVKMREARRMLGSGQFLVGEVAHHLAFSDAAHFSRRYRRFYRCPPSRHVESRPGGAGSRQNV